MSPVGRATDRNITRGNLGVLTEIEPMGCSWDTGTPTAVSWSVEKMKVETMIWGLVFTSTAFDLIFHILTLGWQVFI